MNLNNFIILAVLPPAILCSLVGTALVRFIAVQRSWYDDPSDPRKIHSGKIPRLGGVGMFWAFALTLGGAALVLRGGAFATATFAPPLILAFGIAHFTGLVDDFRNIRAWKKLVLQILAAVILVAAGFRFRSLPLPGQSLELGVFSYPLSLLWIVGVTNAVNMIDGMDGLAGGLSAIAAFTYGVIYATVGNSAAALAAFALAGAIGGFLLHNYPPAKIFMGDSGSLFLGIALASLPLLHRGANPQEAGILPGITLVLIPVLDVFACMLRRLKRGVSPMSPDKEHLHHKLMSLGFENRTALLIIYSAQLGLACLVLSGLIVPYRFFFGILMLAWAGMALGFIWLHFATDPKQRWEDYVAMKEAEAERRLKLERAREDEGRFRGTGE